MSVSKFEKYIGKQKFSVAGEEFVIDFKVRDRIALSAVYDNKSNQTKYTAMIEFCVAILMKNYPEETQENIEAFLTGNMDAFVSELMISAGLLKKEDIEKAKEEVKKALPQ